MRSLLIFLVTLWAVGTAAVPVLEAWDINTIGYSYEP